MDVTKVVLTTQEVQNLLTNWGAWLRKENEVPRSINPICKFMWLYGVNPMRPSQHGRFISESEALVIDRILRKESEINEYRSLWYLIAQMKYSEGEMIADIADRLDVTTKRVRRILNRITSHLLENSRIELELKELMQNDRELID